MRPFEYLISYPLAFHAHRGSIKTPARIQVTLRVTELVDERTSPSHLAALEVEYSPSKLSENILHRRTRTKHSFKTLDIFRLSGIGLNFALGALGSLLGSDTTTGLTTGGAGSGLCLLGLLLGLGCRLLILAFLDGGQACSITGLWSLCAALLDHVERGSHDGALVLDGATSSLLGDFLYLTNVFMSVYCLQRSNIGSGGQVRKFGNCGIVHVGN